MKRTFLLVLLIGIVTTGFSQTKPSYLQLKDTPINCVNAFGAKPDDGIDDTDAFVAALLLGSIQVPAGEYDLDANRLSLTKVGQSIFGSGKDRTILKFSAITGPQFALTMSGATTPSYQSYQAIKDLTISGPVGVDGNGINITTNAHFKLENVKIASFLEGIVLEQALIFRLQECEFLYNKLAIEFRDGAAGFNLIKFEDCSFLANLRVVSCDLTASSTYGGGSGIVFDGCQIEANGRANQIEPILSFTGNIGGVGNPPTVTFKECWFERNISSAAELLFAPTTAFPTGITLLNNQFYSTEVLYNVVINAPKAIINMQGNGMTATLSSGNPVVYVQGSENKGVILGNAFATSNIATSTGLLFSDDSTFIREITLKETGGIALYNPSAGTTYIKTDPNGNCRVSPITSIMGIAGGLRLEGISTTTAQINTIFVDSEDALLKYKEASGTVKILY